ncbi:Uncharacterized protein Adt_01584 [Abeliophyllum distichum]|uniref:Uncharacterized protein n=1 Tax=Abeliophyllum distichum TaxID=126358 RepID=A0ABD1VTQ1_9LAMI
MNWPIPFLTCNPSIIQWDTNSLGANAPDFSLSTLCNLFCTRKSCKRNAAIHPIPPPPPSTDELNGRHMHGHRETRAAQNCYPRFKEVDTSCLQVVMKRIAAFTL